jgi:hypothetical protein
LITSEELAVSPVHAFKVQALRYTTAEVPPVASMVLTIEMEHVTVSGAPPGPAARLLHWENETVAADAAVVFDSNTAALKPAESRIAAKTTANRRKRRRRGCSWTEVFMVNTPSS